MLFCWECRWGRPTRSPWWTPFQRAARLQALGLRGEGYESSTSAPPSCPFIHTWLAVLPVRRHSVQRRVPGGAVRSATMAGAEHGLRVRLDILPPERIEPGTTRCDGR